MRSSAGNAGSFPTVLFPLEGQGGEREAEGGEVWELSQPRQSVSMALRH